MWGCLTRYGRTAREEEEEEKEEEEEEEIVAAGLVPRSVWGDAVAKDQPHLITHDGYYDESIVRQNIDTPLKWL